MRRNTQKLYESIMKVVDRSVRKALNEQISQKDMADWADEAGEMYTHDELDDYDSIFTDETFRYIADNGTLPPEFKKVKLNREIVERLAVDICDLKRSIPDIDKLVNDDINTFKKRIKDTSASDFCKKYSSDIRSYEGQYMLDNGYKLMFEIFKFLRDNHDFDKYTRLESAYSFYRTIAYSKTAQKLCNIALFAANVYIHTGYKKLCFALESYLGNKNGFMNSLSPAIKEKYNDKNNGIIDLDEIIKIKTKFKKFNIIDSDAMKIQGDLSFAFRNTFDAPVLYMLDSILYDIFK